MRPGGAAAAGVARGANPNPSPTQVLREYNADFLASVERGQAARYEHPAPLTLTLTLTLNLTLTLTLTLTLPQP